MPSRENSLETRLKKTRLLLCCRNGRCLIYGEERKAKEYEKHDDDNGKGEDEEDEYVLENSEDCEDCEAKTVTDDSSSNNLTADQFSTEEQRFSGLQAIFASMEEEKEDEERRETNVMFEDSIDSFDGEYSNQIKGAKSATRDETLELLKKEEDILRDLLDKVRTRRYRLTHGKRQMHVIDYESEEIYEEDFGDAVEEELSRFSPSQRINKGTTEIQFR